MSKELGERIEELLIMHDMSHKELADQLEMTESAISRYITGDREPKYYVLCKIADILQTSIDFLLGYHGNKGEYNFSTTYDLIARNANKMSSDEKARLVLALMGGQN